MALFDWFSKKSKPDAVRPPEQIERATPITPEPPIDRRKHQRHARREELYVAIREAMTRSGVLSAGYKFKVLSLDQTGDAFMVMVDLAQGFGAGFDRLSELEAAIIKNAGHRFDIAVPTVYWRLADTDVFTAPRLDTTRERDRALASARPAFTKRHAIDDDGVAAFNRALLAASSKSRPASIEETVRLGGKALDYPPLVDFADTEIANGSESQAAAALGKTQYGDLN